MSEGITGGRESKIRKCLKANLFHSVNSRYLMYAVFSGLSFLSVFCVYLANEHTQERFPLLFCFIDYPNIYFYFSSFL